MVMLGRCYVQSEYYIIKGNGGIVYVIEVLITKWELLAIYLMGVA